MSYTRVIPRDLFNEANLLKCYGRIYINLETAGLDNVELVHDGEPFDIQQDENSGDIFVANVVLEAAGKPCRLHRPLNSRAPWPLCLTTDEEEQIQVFNEDGAFTDEFVRHMRALVETRGEMLSGPSARQQ